MVAQAAVFLVVNGNSGESLPFLASDFSSAGVRTQLAPGDEAALFGHILPAATLERDVDLLAVAAAAEAHISTSSSRRRLSSLSPDRHDVRVLFRLGNGAADSLGGASPYGAAAINSATSATAVDGAVAAFTFPERPATVPVAPSPSGGGGSDELPAWVLGVAAGAAAAGALALGAALAFFLLGRGERLRAVSAGGGGGGERSRGSEHDTSVGAHNDDLCHAGRHAATRLGLAPATKEQSAKRGMFSRFGFAQNQQQQQLPGMQDQGQTSRSRSVSAQNRELRTAMATLASVNEDGAGGEGGFDNPMLLSRTFSAGSTYDHENSRPREHTRCVSMQRVAAADVTSLLVSSCEELPPVSVPVGLSISISVSVSTSIYISISLGQSDRPKLPIHDRNSPHPPLAHQGVANAWARLRASGVPRAAVAVAAMVRAIPTERLLRLRRDGAAEAEAAVAAAAKGEGETSFGPESRRSSFASFMDEEEALAAWLEQDSDDGTPFATPPLPPPSPHALVGEEEQTRGTDKKMSRKEKRAAEAARRRLLRESSLLASMDARHSAELSPLFAALAKEAGAVGAAKDTRTPCEELCGLAEAVATRAKENVCVAAAAAAAIRRHQRGSQLFESKSERSIGTMLTAVVSSQLRTAWRARRAAERLRYACEFERGSAAARGGVQGTSVAESCSHPRRSGVDSGSSGASSLVGNVLGAVTSTLHAGAQLTGLDSHIAALLSAADEENTTSARWRRSMTIDEEGEGDVGAAAADDTASCDDNDDNASVASASSVEIAGRLSGVM